MGADLSALVLFMTPGLALFYGGMDRTRNVLNMLMMNFWCLLIVPIVWAVGGFSLAQVPFENDFIGNFDAAFLRGVRHHSVKMAVRASSSIIFLGDVRGDHAGADLGRGGGPHEVLGLGDLRARLADARVRPRVQVGLRRLARPARLARLRRRHGHPRQRRHRGPGAPCSCSASARAGPARATRRTRCPSSCSAPASCGSGGSASTPDRHSPPTARPSRRS